MTIAILCSGQGTQHRDMFALTAEAPEAAAVFAAATQALDGRDPRAIVREKTRRRCTPTRWLKRFPARKRSPPSLH